MSCKVRAAALDGHQVINAMNHSSIIENYNPLLTCQTEIRPEAQHPSYNHLPQVMLGTFPGTLVHYNY